MAIRHTHSLEDLEISSPPKGHFEVKNLYVNKNTGKLVVEYDDTPAVG